MGELCQDHSAHSLSIELHDKRLDAHSINQKEQSPALGE